MEVVNQFIDDLRQRGMVQDIMPGTEDLLNKNIVSGYVGFDPTADSLHIGNLVSIMLLKRLQLAGHKPIALVGGATGMIGDPSGKSSERNLLSEDVLLHNQKCIHAQLQKFLTFDDSPIGAEMVNNYDWFKDFSFLGFLREVGKFLTVNYMTAKDSVQKRLETGLSFTEFTYQLVQGYDFYWLYKNKNVRLQMGGSDQWGNIVTGTELIRRKDGGEAFAMTCPLITKADGSKFGKSESGNIWLDRNKTSPYQFYQFWINTADEDAERYIKIFSLLDLETIQSIIDQHVQDPGLRLLQKTLAKEVTCLVHSEEDYNQCLEASEILFGKSGQEALQKLSPEMLLSALEGVPFYAIETKAISDQVSLIDLLAEMTDIFPSKGEAKKMIQASGLSINKNKVTDGNVSALSINRLHDRFLFIQKGKKNYYLVDIR
jgi:tyrosyl-tRNA synthetase